MDYKDLLCLAKIKSNVKSARNDAVEKLDVYDEEKEKWETLNTDVFRLVDRQAVIKIYICTVYTWIEAGY